jgi:hypothetical protein
MTSLRFDIDMTVAARICGLHAAMPPRSGLAS